MTLPANAVQVQGQGVVTADNLNTYVQYCSTAPVLRTFIGANNMTVYLLGIAAINDEGQGSFYWDGSSTADDDNFSIIVPSGVTSGAWIRSPVASAATPGSPLGGAISSASGLVVTWNSGTPNTRVDVSATGVLLANSTGQIRLANFSTTVNLLASGANGLDTGSAGASTWYYVFVIAGVQTDGTVISAGLFSTSSSSPTLPTGYTIAYRVGSRYTDASTHFYRVLQAGNRAQYVVGTLPATPRLMTSGVHGSVGPTPTWFAVSTVTFVPPTASAIQLNFSNGGADGGVCGVAPNNGYTLVGYAPLAFNLAAATSAAITAMVNLESSNVYYVSADAQTNLFCTGWIDNI